jgi:glycosyltransferase involved in cell wall biosynthesis
MNPCVSIIINNYNYGCYIREAIESVFAQTYREIELIIVDDGSTDDSRAVLNEYLDCAQVIFKANAGQASALNVGIMQAKGDYILLLDSDDYLFPEAVATCVQAFPGGYSRVYYRLQVVDENSRPVVEDIGENLFRAFDGDFSAMLDTYGGIYWAPTSANFFAAQKLKAILPVPEAEWRVCADAFVTVRTSLEGPIRSIDKKLAAYRIHGNNNYCIKSRLLSDEKVLKTRIEDHYRIPALIEAACKEAGYSWNQQQQDDELLVLQMLCAGHKLSLDTPHVAGLRITTLFARIIRYLRCGDGPRLKRVRGTIYLSVILFVPAILARKLLRLKDRWSFG